MMKCCVIILVLFFQNVFLCDAAEIAHRKKDTDCVENTKIPSKKMTRRFNKFKNHLPFDLTGNATSNRIQLKNIKDRFLNEYFVITCGGHVLSTFRLIRGDTDMKARPKKCPVLLVHGLFQSSDRFLEQDEDQSLAFKLQDLGYDVWLANMRTNKYNRVHLILEPEINDDDERNFFTYNYEDLGILDIAATVDFVLKVTRYNKLIYIGHSLGGTAFLVLSSLKEEYNKKIGKAYLLAPLGYHSYFPNDALMYEAKRSNEIFTTLSKGGTYEIFPYKNEDETFTPEDCLGDKRYRTICEGLNIRDIMGLKRIGNNVDETRGGSIGPLLHLAQNVRSGNFTRFDYGKDENLKRYQCSTPPTYNLKSVTVPTTIIYAPNDEFVSPEDIAKMAEDMPEAETRSVERTSFKHEDFVIGSDAMENVYDYIIYELESDLEICSDRKGSGNSGEGKRTLLQQTKRQNEIQFRKIFKNYMAIWLSIPLIFILAVIAIVFLNCNRRRHNKKHCREELIS